MEEALRALIAPLCPVHWGAVPQAARPPLIRLRKISGGVDLTQDGWRKPGRARVQADVYGRSYEDTSALVRRLVDELVGRSGGGFERIAIAGEIDLPTTDAGGNVVQHRTSVDLIIHWRG